MRHTVICLAFAVIAMMLPRYAVAGDVEIAQQIAAQLRAQKDAHMLKGFHIGVKVEDSKVWMKGQVSDANQRSLALDIARRVPGVKMVVNELHIKAANSATPTLASPTSAIAKTAPPALRQPTSAQPVATNKVVIPAPGLANGSLGITAPKTAMAAPARAEPQLQETMAAHVVAAQNQIGISAPPIASRPMAGSTARFPVSAPMATGSAVVARPAAGSSVPSLQLRSPAAGAPAVVTPSASTTAQNALARRRLMPQPAQMPRPIASIAMTSATDAMVQSPTPVPMATPASAVGGGVPAVMHDHPQLPAHAWPSYATYPNYAALTYPRQYSPTAWPYIGPFYPYPQVPLGWRKVTLEWDDGWWFLDFKAK